jgi:3',5'-cyclic-AMP phosphodiesterase
MRMKFIHLTDTHLVEPGREIYGLNPQVRLRAAIDSINREHADALHVIVTGDLAHFGEHAAYVALKAELARLANPVHLLIGNHDDRATFRIVFDDAPVDDDGHVQFAFTSRGTRFIGLDSNEPGVSWGVFDERRSAWLARELDCSGTLPVYLFVHHPPLAIGIGAMDRISLRDPTHLHRVSAPHRGRIRHLFFGHLHRPLAGSWLGIPISTVRATNHQVALALGDSPFVPGSHEPPQYAVVLSDGESTVVHFHDYADRSKRFEL